MKYELILLATSTDINNCLKNIHFFKNYLDYSTIKIITQKVNRELIECCEGVEFIDEDTLLEGLNYKRVKEEFLKMNLSAQRVGWYYQQFLKLAYSFKSQFDYYLVWDADTIPVKKIDIFSEENRPIFGMKEEYHEEYFTMINNLFGFSKSSEKSFISEHMIFRKEYVQEMILEIQQKHYLEGNSFWEKVLHAVDGKTLLKGAFSEFETYGTWVLNRHPDSYELRGFSSNRLGKSLIGYPPKKKYLHKMAEYYDAISFESWDKGSKIISIIRTIDVFQMLPISFYLKVCDRIWKKRYEKMDE